MQQQQAIGGVVKVPGLDGVQAGSSKGAAQKPQQSYGPYGFQSGVIAKNQAFIEYTIMMGKLKALKEGDDAVWQDAPTVFEGCRGAGARRGAAADGGDAMSEVHRLAANLDNLEFHCPDTSMTNLAHGGGGGFGTHPVPAGSGAAAAASSAALGTAPSGAANTGGSSSGAAAMQQPVSQQQQQVLAALAENSDEEMAECE